MPKIIQLEQHVADLIAAGEVVSRPASVVKELAENSIDAGATCITVEIASGGMSCIRVTDNGCGIAPEDAKTAFLRHATSKLHDASGLDSIETLGFRGEALAAIAAVSKIELLTRTQDAGEGVRLTLTAGEETSFAPFGCPVGTTIIVRDLFFNTPARLKFMKTDRAEGSAVSSAALRIALSRPDISFRYIKDGKTEFHTPGDSKADSCIYTLLGRDIEAGFIPVNLSDEFVSVSGYTSLPSAARGNRSYQFFFINGRIVRSLLMQSALEQAYSKLLVSGRFPACALYISTGAGNVDVNVHPAKTEVRFISDKQIFDGVYYAVQGALERSMSTAAGEKSGHEVSGAAPVYSGGFKKLTVDEFRRPYSSPTAGTSKKTNHVIAAPEPQSPEVTGDQQGIAGQMSRYTSLSCNDEKVPPGNAQTPVSPPFRVVGEVLGTYIVVESEGSVWFIDKHAAHERIHFDALAGGKYTPMSESLISPIVCRIGFSEASILLENEELLDTLGFTAESFGEDSVAVRHIPSDIRQGDVEPVLREICEALGRGGAPKAANLDKIYKTIACKTAIKAGSISDIRELEALTARVMSGEISHCPHGRPVAFEVSRTMLEKSFNRN